MIIYILSLSFPTDKEHKKEYILAEARLIELFKAPELYEIKERFKGATLKGKRYLPLFTYFEGVCLSYLSIYL